MREKIKIKDIGEVISGSTPKTGIQEYWNGNNNWITPAELTDKSYLIDETERKITNLAIEKTSLRKLPKGTVLLTSRAPIGKVAIANTEMYCNQGFKNIVCNEKIYNKFLYYFLKSKTDYLNSLGRGATFKEISKSIVENIEIPYFSIEEQKEVVKVFEKVQQLIDINEEQKLLFDNLIKSQFVEMFGDIENTKYDVYKLSELTNLITDGEHKKPNYTEKGTPFISVVNITTGELKFEDCKFVSKEEACKFNKRCNPEKDDILYTKVGATYGRSAIVDTDKKFALYVSVCLIKPKKDLINPIFLNYTMRQHYVKSQADKSIKGIGVPDLHLIEIKNFKIILPPIELQNQFADIVKQIDKQKFEIQNRLIELKKVKEYLMNKYFD